MKEKNNQTKHGLPAFASFFIPGLGQAIKGHVIKAALFLVIAFCAYLSMLVLIGFIAVPVTHVLSACDAYNSNTDKIQIVGD